jgi:hypothetical protein
MFFPANSTNPTGPSAPRINSTDSVPSATASDNIAHVIPSSITDASVHAITAWWPTANIVLGVMGAIAALSLAIYQIRLARRQLHATHRIESGA